jgi:hypothetical protein
MQGRKHGKPEVCNAIGAQINDEIEMTTLLALIIPQAQDAISGARPGASSIDSLIYNVDKRFRRCCFLISRGE